MSTAKDNQQSSAEFADPIDMILLCSSLYWTYAGEYTRMMCVSGVLLLKAVAQKPLSGNDYKEKAPEVENMAFITRLLEPLPTVEVNLQEEASTCEIVQELHAEELCDPEEACDEKMLKAPSQTPQLASIDVTFEKSKSISARREAIKRMRARAYRMHYQSLSRTASQPTGYNLSRGASSDTLASPSDDMDREKAKEFQFEDQIENAPKPIKSNSRKRRSVLGWLQSQAPAMDVAVDAIKKTVPSLMSHYLELAAVAALLELPQKQRKSKLSSTIKQTLAQAHDMANYEYAM